MRADSGPSEDLAALCSEAIVMALPRMRDGPNSSRTTNAKGLQMQAFQWAILGSNQ